MNKRLSECIGENIETISSLQKFSPIIEKCVKLMTKNIRKGGKIMLCGNGGSAADAQHLAAEFLIRLNPKKKRPPLPAIALSTDTSTITACGNDFSFDKIFQRTFEALFKKNDILIAISTSGNSKNIINVLKFAKKKKILSIGFLGKNGGKAKFFCDLKIIVDSLNTARIQESHIFLGHYIFSEIENRLFK
jgi:D-sedoheptulose 7-phosphate isomerase